MIAIGRCGGGYIILSVVFVFGVAYVSYCVVADHVIEGLWVNECVGFVWLLVEDASVVGSGWCGQNEGEVGCDDGGNGCERVVGSDEEYAEAFSCLG